MEWQKAKLDYLRPCPACGYINIATKFKDTGKALMQNGYVCHCGKQYKEYRFCWNRDAKGNKVNAMKAEQIRIKSKKTDKETDAYLLRDNSIVILKDGVLHSIKQHKVVILK